MKTNPVSSTRTFTHRTLGATGIGARPLTRGTSRNVIALLLVLFTIGAGEALASDPIGIYALVDKVVFEPSAANPERIQVWGAFAIAEGTGSTYKEAQRG